MRGFTIFSSANAIFCEKSVFLNPNAADCGIDLDPKIT